MYYFRVGKVKTISGPSASATSSNEHKKSLNYPKTKNFLDRRTFWPYVVLPFHAFLTVYRFIVGRFTLRYLTLCR